jgi:hypothetical protein
LDTAQYKGEQHLDENGNRAPTGRERRNERTRRHARPSDEREQRGRSGWCDTMSHVLSRFVDWRFGVTPET